MKANKLSISSFLIALFLFISPALALPCAFSGQVQLDGSPTNGTYVEAYYLNGTFISKGKEPSAGFGHYSIAVNAPGQNVTLKIKGIPVDQGNEFCENGLPISLNISATTPPTTITTTTVYSGGGGGSGGSSKTTTTINTTTSIVTTTVIPQTTIVNNENSNIGKSTTTTIIQKNDVNKFGLTGLFLDSILSQKYWFIPIVLIIILLAIAFTRKSKHMNENKKSKSSKKIKKISKVSTQDNETVTETSEATDQDNETIETVPNEETNTTINNDSITEDEKQSNNSE